MRKRTVKRIAWRSKRYFKSDKSPLAGSQHSRRGKGQKSQKSKIFGRLVSLSLLLVLFGLIINWSFVKGVEVTIKGASGQEETARDLQKQIEQIYAEQIKHRFKPLLNQTELAKLIETEVLQLDQIEVRITAFDSQMQVAASLRQPKAYILSSNQDKLLIDQNGHRYTLGEDKLGKIKIADLPQLIDTSPLNQANQVGGGQDNTPFPVSVIDFVYKMNNILVNQNLSRSAIKVEIGTESRQVIWKPEGESYGVKFNTERDPLDQAQEYKAMHDYLKRRGIVPQSYIDMRVDDTAYYR